MEQCIKRVTNNWSVIMKILSWNVNGIRARHNKGFLKQVFDEQPDIICIQEVKANMEKLPEPLKNIDNYNLLLNSYDNPAYGMCSHVYI